MKKAILSMHGIDAGILIQEDSYCQFTYFPDYDGEPVSLTLPLSNGPYYFKDFPPFLDGLLPEGAQLEALLHNTKLDRNDYFEQLLRVGQDLVGALTVRGKND